MAGCREPIVALGGKTSASIARARAEAAFWALGARVIEPMRDAKYDAARIKIVPAALLPSRVWDDTSVWTSGTPNRRTLLISGRFTGQRYLLGASRAAAWPAHPAESRHQIDLTRLRDDEFAWNTEVAYAIGDVTAADVGAFMRAFFASAEGRDEGDIRANYRAAAPRTTVALGQLFRVDSIKTADLPDSSTLTTFSLTMSTQTLARHYPEFAAYTDRYVETANMHWGLEDRAGARYLDAWMRNGRIQLRARTHRGQLLPIAGPPRPIPDSLVLIGDVTMKVRMFTVGVRRYRSEFTLTREAHETGFKVVSRQEPDWVLPLITERLLRTPLRRPFQGAGALFAMSVRDTAGAQTILLRTLHLEVQESAILRFIGRLSSIALSDFAGKAEDQEMAWLHEVFGALVADTHALPF